MCGPAAFAAAAAGSAVLGAYGQYQEGRASAAAAKATSQNLMEQAAQEEQAGAEQRAAIRAQGAQMLGQGRVAFAQGGADLSFGTPTYWEVGAAQEIQADVRTSTTNTERRAGALRFESALTQAQGRAARRAGTMGAFTSLIGGAARTGQTYNSFR